MSPSPPDPPFSKLPERQWPVRTLSITERWTMAQVCCSIVPKSNSPAIHCFAVSLLFHITILLSCHFIVSLFYRLATSLACCPGVSSLYCYTVSLFHHLTIISFFHSPLLSAFVGYPPLFAITKRFCFFWALSAFHHHQTLPLFAVVRHPQWASFAFAIAR